MLLAAKTRPQQSHQVIEASDYCVGRVVVALCYKEALSNGHSQSVRPSVVLRMQLKNNLEKT